MNQTMKIVSVFTVTDFTNDKKEEVLIQGTGQTAIALLRKDYPRFSKFVLEGFEIDGYFYHLDI